MYIYIYIYIYTSFHCIYVKYLFLFFLLSTGYFYLLCPLWLGSLLCYPPQIVFSSASSSSQLSACSNVLFISSYYLGHCSFSPWYSYWGNSNCTKGILLIVCTEMSVLWLPYMFFYLNSGWKIIVWIYNIYVIYTTRKFDMTTMLRTTSAAS